MHSLPQIESEDTPCPFFPFPFSPPPPPSSSSPLARLSQHNSHDKQTPYLQPITTPSHHQPSGAGEIRYLYPDSHLTPNRPPTTPPHVSRKKAKQVDVSRSPQTHLPSHPIPSHHSTGTPPKIRKQEASHMRMQPRASACSGKPARHVGALAIAIAAAVYIRRGVPSGLRYWFVLGRGMVREATWVVVGMEDGGLSMQFYFIFCVKLPLSLSLRLPLPLPLSRTILMCMYEILGALEFICITHTTAWALKARDSI
jgi:hypothetical protein